MLKRNCFAAPFEQCFALQQAGSASAKPIVIEFREQETLYLSAEKDRVTIVFSTMFRDVDDIVIGKVFLQEFVDARRNVQNAPQVLFSQREPPRELQNAPGAKVGDNVGYVTFGAFPASSRAAVPSQRRADCCNTAAVLFPRHFQNDKRDLTINLIQTFRDYLHYHIKCSKAYLHSRMRARVETFLKILNRARPEDKTAEKKTATGKTFRRKV